MAAASPQVSHPLSCFDWSPDGVLAYVYIITYVNKKKLHFEIRVGVRSPQVDHIFLLDLLSACDLYGKALLMSLTSSILRLVGM